MIQISRISLRRWSATATIAIVAATSALPAQAQHDRHGGGRPEYRGGGYHGGGHGGHGGGGLAGGLVVGALLGAVAGAAISNATQAPPADVYSAPPPPPPPGAYYYPNSYPAGY
jgi:hypothetical protein